MVLGLRTTAGDLRWLQFSTTQILKEADRFEGVVISFSDITAHREQEDRLRFVLDGAGLGTWDWNIATSAVTYNEQWALMLGYSQSDVAPDTIAWERLIHPDDRDRVAAVLQQHLDGHTREYRCELRLRRKDGGWAWILDVGRVIERDSDGLPQRAAGVHVDISARHALEDDFEQLHNRYVTAVEGTSDGLWDWDIRNQTLWLSPRYWELLGYEPTITSREGTFSAFLERVHVDDRAKIELAVAAHLECGADYDVDHRLRVESGAYRWFRSRGRAQRDARGTPTRMAGTIQDVTELEQTARSLRKAREDAESALREVSALRGALDEHALLSVTDRRGRIIEVNTGFCQISGYSREELLGRSHNILRSGRHSASFWATVWATISTGQPWRGEICNRSKSGALYWVDTTIVPSLDAHKKVEKYVSLRFDITARKAAEAQLLAARAEAQSANASKSEFLANMSHEIRTPMTAIMGFTDMIASEHDCGREQRLEYVETIKRNGEHLIALINDILDISKIEAGKMETEVVACSPVELVHEVLDLMDVKAKAKGLALEARFTSSIPAAVQTDPVRLRQILVNLVGNALKFTEIGGVSIEINCDLEAQRLRFDVHDTGIGLAEDQLEKLFGAFVQADSSTTRKFGGTGLGLRISKRLAEMLGGDISVASAIGRGSTFTATITTGALNGVPFIQPDSSSAAAPKPALPARLNPGDERALSGQRVLLAEDGPDNQRLISFHLAKCGATVHVVENGRQAIEALTINHTLDGLLLEPPPFDLIVTDMQMPELDGYDAARRLRSKGCVLPIVALTANAMAGDEQRSLDAGCDSYTTKPIDRARLIESIRFAIERRPARNETAA